ncbi:hypothetical protein J2X03_003818 [Microbacterium trichothecenolyticum]|nr:hypothetical protein [Microbacterium trichothecenolyticum]
MPYALIAIAVALAAVIWAGIVLAVLDSRGRRRTTTTEEN